MFPSISELKGYFKPPSISTETYFVFLNTKLYPIILLFFGIVLTFQHFIRDSIVCTAFHDQVNIKVAEQHCWIRSTFINVLNSTKLLSMIQFPLVEPGISLSFRNLAYPGAHPPARARSWDGPVRYQYYYKWTFLVILVQAVLYYSMLAIWRYFEGGKTKVLASKPVYSKDSNKSSSNTIKPRGQYFKGCRYDMDLDRQRDHAAMLISYLKVRLTQNNLLFFGLLLTEFACIVLLGSTVLFYDSFLGGDFLTYGFDVANFYFCGDIEDVDPAEIIFPRMGKCMYEFAGYGGAAIESTGLCFLPMNEVNDKIFIFIWSWSIVMICFGITSFLFHLSLALVPAARVYFLKIVFPGLDLHVIKRLVFTTSIGEFIQLVLLGYNVDPILFQRLVKAYEKIANAKKYG